MTTTHEFREVQYAGRNSYGLSRRLVMALFLLIAHYYSGSDENLEGALLLLGGFLLLFSIVLLFVPSYTILLQHRTLVLKPAFGKEIHLSVETIAEASIAPYSRFHFNNIVFNVFDAGEHKFYAEGSKALLVNLKEAAVYRIGCKNAETLLQQITAIHPLS